MIGKWMKTAVAMGISAMLLCAPADAAKVVVDAGHGGKDPGAIGVNQLREKDVNLDIALKLRQALTDRGYIVAMTRDQDIYLTLQERVEQTNREQADVFVSIHANAHRSSSVRGSLVLYYDRNYPQAKYPASSEMSALTPQSKALASYVLDEMVRAVGTQNRGIVPSAAYVVRSGTIPSILVETAFLSNPQDAALLATEWARISFAEAIAEGIARYLPIGFSDIKGHWASGSIVRLKESGLVAGVDGKYEPNRGITRAEFLAMVDRIFHLQSLSPADHGPLLKNEDRNESNDPNVDDIPTITDHVASDEDTIDGEDVTVSATHEKHILAPPHTSEATDSVQEVYAEEDTYTPDLAVTEGAGDHDGDMNKAFHDLAESHWAYALLESAVSTGILEGYPDGTIRPDQTITRAEMSVLFDRIWQAKEEQVPEDSNVPDSHTTVPSFHDVPAQAWFTDAVYRMARASLINGIEPQRFGPNQTMTRAQMAVVLDRYLQQHS